jgi:hypothetical protein
MDYARQQREENNRAAVDTFLEDPKTDHIDCILDYRQRKLVRPHADGSTVWSPSTRRTRSTESLLPYLTAWRISPWSCSYAYNIASWYTNSLQDLLRKFSSFNQPINNFTDLDAAILYLIKSIILG